MEHDGELPPLGAPNYFDTIYDRYILLQTWAVLRGTRQIALPDDVDPLVQGVYEGPPLTRALSSEAVSEFETAKMAMEKEIASDRADARAVGIGNPFDRTWEVVPPLRREDEEGAGRFLPISTRKGRRSVKAVILYPSSSADYLLHPDDAHPVSLTKEPDFREARRIVLQAVRLSRFDVVRGLLEQDVPRTGWERSALLRDCYPLIMDGEHNVFGRTRVEYSPEVGILYERNENKEGE